MFNFVSTEWTRCMIRVLVKLETEIKILLNVIVLASIGWEWFLNFQQLTKLRHIKGKVTFRRKFSPSLEHKNVKNQKWKIVAGQFEGNLIGCMYVKFREQMLEIGVINVQISFKKWIREMRV